MKATKIQYTVKEDFAETNKANIKAVMADLKSTDLGNLNYTAFVKTSGNFLFFLGVFISLVIFFLIILS